MSRAALVTIIIAALLAAQKQAAPVIPLPEPTPAATAPAFDTAPPCVLDWGLPVTPDNQTLLVRCYKLLQAAGLIGIANWPCPTAGSEWEKIFNTYYCWQKNHPQTPEPMPTPTPIIGYP